MHALLNRRTITQSPPPLDTPLESALLESATQSVASLETAKNTPALPFSNRGFLIGDGVFTTLLAIDGAPQHWAAHCERLKRDAEVFRLSFNEVGLYDAVKMLLALNSLTTGLARVRITLTRENTSLGSTLSGAPIPCPSHASPLRLNGTEQPIELITATPYAPPQTPVRLTISSIPRGIPGLLTQTKHLGYQAAFLSVMEATDKGYDDALMLNHYGRVVSATTANLFVRVRDQWITPPINEGALPGIMRQHILNQHTIPDHIMKEKPITVADLQDTSAAFITNCLIGIRPIAYIDDVQLNMNHPDINRMRHQLIQP